MKSFFNEKKSGFTIIELLVAMSIFVILTTIVAGAFIQSLRSERRLVALMSVSNNVGLTLEQITREIRTGYKFSSGGANLSFSSAAGNISYSLVGNKIQRSIGGGGAQDVTADNVSVTSLNFIVSREGQAAMNYCTPWRVTIVMTVSAAPAVANSSITLQTTASSRILPREVPRLEKAGSDFKDCR